MEPMEMDFELDDDPVKKFLFTKLAEIKSANADLESDLKTRRDLLSLSERKIAELRGPLKVSGVWKRVIHSRCVFGITIENSSSGKLKLTGVVLNWNSSRPLTYSVRLYTKADIVDWVPTKSVGISTTVLVIVLREPQFLKQLDFDVEGFINYRGEPGECYQLPLSKLRVSAGDFTDSALQVQRFKLLGSADEEFLSCLAASEAAEFVGKIVGNVRRKAERVLEIDCSFSRFRKTFFLVDGVSPSIDGCLLELRNTAEDGTFYFRVFSRTQEEVKRLLHYMHRSVEGLSVLPKAFDIYLKKKFTSASQSFSEDVGEDDETSVDFREALLQEICFVEDKIKRGEGDVKFRNELSDLEMRTDSLRVQYDV